MHTLAHTLPMVVSRPEGRVMPEHQRGIEKRHAILEELYRRELAQEPSPTSGDLAMILRVDQKTAYFHMVSLRDEGLVTWEPRAARTLRLTPAGRARVAKI